jgi:hypothetical protein
VSDAVTIRPLPQAATGNIVNSNKTDLIRTPDSHQEYRA